jgi:hypothetical protein
MDPIPTPLRIKQRVEFRRDFRFKAGTAFADLTGYNAIAEIWNDDRSIKYADFTVTWLNRVITNTALDGDYHLRLSLPEAATIRTDEDAFWDLRMEPPNLLVEPAFYAAEGKVTFVISYSDND